MKAVSSAPVRATSRPLTVVSLLLGLFLAAMEMTVVSTAMPTVVVASLASALQGAMGIVFWTDAVIAVAAFVVTLGFPHVEIAPRRARAEGGVAGR